MLHGLSPYTGGFQEIPEHPGTQEGIQHHPIVPHVFCSTAKAHKESPI